LPIYGTLNTAILLTSSLTMALAVHAAEVNRLKALTRFLLATVFLASCFLIVKGLEYHDDLRENLWPGPHFRAGLPVEAQIFWFLYWVMTGLHALHVTVGVGLISWLAWQSSKRRFSAAYYNPVDVIALYWHFVDIVWIFLYPLLYLINRHT
jgi:cytochrome c oxidase subunit III